MPAVASPQQSAIIVVGDPVLAASLELALLAGGLNAFIYDPAQGLDRLPLDIAMTLIVNASLLTPDPATFVSGLRECAWDGLVILMTGDAASLEAAFQRSHRVVLLEMPFVGADLIAVIREAWGPDGSVTQP